ncbi:MAG: hypothetical protein EPO46_06240 [Lysobacter sp.]|nr:MAG: hypothetical protein EPO46_06240 [Lysobacter sp.]
MDARPNRLLTFGAALSATAAALHVAIIFGGPDWYRFFGAGERFAQLDAAGSRVPALMTLGIATVLALWSAYALSGAGWLRRLPLLRTALVTISAIYLLRGLVLAPMLVMDASQFTPFDWWSSIICLGYGVVHAVGLAQVWPGLPKAPPVDPAPVTAEVVR